MGATPKKMDFSKVKDGGGFRKKRMPEGDYVAKITKVEDAKSKAGNEQWVFSIQLKDHPSCVYPYYCGHDPDQLWKSRNLAIAAGLNVPKKRVNFDPNKLVNKLVGVTLEDDEYDGREQSTIAGFLPVSEVADADEDADEDDEEVEEEVDEDEEEEEPPKAKKGKKAKAKPADEDDEDLEELEIEEL